MNGALDIAVSPLAHGQGLPLPRRQTEGAAGADLVAALAPGETLRSRRGGGRWCRGLRLALPEGIEGQVRPRSGLALRHGVTVLNAPGTIDADYRGEVQVILVNLGQAPFAVRRGDRIAQLVVAPVSAPRFSLTEALDDTDRGAGGFGSTGH